MARTLKLLLPLLLIAGCKKATPSIHPSKSVTTYYRVIGINKHGDSVYSNQVVKYVKGPS